jgi:hypothetical protein
VTGAAEDGEAFNQRRPVGTRESSGGTTPDRFGHGCGFELRLYSDLKTQW